MDRRRFLKRGLFGGALLALGGSGLLALRSTPSAVRPAADLHVVDPKRFAVLVAVASRMVHAAEKDPIAIAHGVDLALAFQSPEAQSDINRVLALLDNGLFGLFTRASPKLFSELSERQQERALASWQTSRLTLLRGAFTALKRLCLGAHYAALENARAIGYPGPFFDKPAPPPIVADQPLSPPFVPSTPPAPSEDLP